MTELDLAESATTRRIIGAFYYVYNRLGHGFLESVYHKALANTLDRAGLHVAREAPVRVVFEGEVVGEFRADLIVERRVIVEVKAVDRLIPAHDAQVLNYLRASHLPAALLLNFGPRMQYRRLVGAAANQRGQLRVDCPATT